MNKCNFCNSKNVSEKLLHEYSLPGFFVPVRAIDSIPKRICHDCEQDSLAFPKACNLNSVVAMLLVLNVYKLSGQDIRYIRKVLSLGSAELAKILEVAPETYSRWENEKTAIGAGAEKLFRLTTALMLVDLTPGITFDKMLLLGMRIPAVHALRNKDELLVKLFSTNSEADDRYWHPVNVSMKEFPALILDNLENNIVEGNRLI